MPERRRVKQTRPLEERLAEQAAHLKEQADQLPAGREREALLRKVRLAETGARLRIGSPRRGCRPRSSRRRVPVKPSRQLVSTWIGSKSRSRSADC